MLLYCILYFAVYQVALVVKNILPAKLPLKHLLFHLAHVGGKVILPPGLFPVTSASEFASKVRDSFRRAVAAELEWNTAHQAEVQLRKHHGDPETKSETHDRSISVAGLYSPYSYSNEHLLGPTTLHDNISAFIGRNRGKTNLVDKYLLNYFLTFCFF